MLWVIDEAHHADTGWYKEVFANDKHSVLGLTATPWRLAKTKGFDHLFDDLITGPSPLELQQEGFFPAVDVRDADVKIELSDEAIARSGEYRADVLDNLPGVAWESPLAAWEQYCQGRKTILYAPSRKAGAVLANRLAERGVGVGFLCDRPNDLELDEGFHSAVQLDRDSVVEGFGNGAVDALVNVDMLTEGFDCPAADAIVLARPTRSLVRYLQCVGRGMRLTPDSEDAVVVVDCFGGWRYLGHPLAPRPWSLSAREEETVGGDAPAASCDTCDAILFSATRRCPHCGSWQGFLCPSNHWTRTGAHDEAGRRCRHGASRSAVVA